MREGYAYTNVKKAYVILGEYFRNLTQQEIILKNPMNSTSMIKKANFLAVQEKEDDETVTVFTAEKSKNSKRNVSDAGETASVSTSSRRHTSSC